MNYALRVFFLFIMRRVDRVKPINHWYYYESPAVVSDMIEVFRGTAALDIAGSTTSSREP